MAKVPEAEKLLGLHWQGSFKEVDYHRLLSWSRENIYQVRKMKSLLAILYVLKSLVLMTDVAMEGIQSSQCVGQH